jgi:hypothetical protein
LARHVRCGDHAGLRQANVKLFVTLAIMTMEGGL